MDSQSFRVSWRIRTRRGMKMSPVAAHHAQRLRKLIRQRELAHVHGHDEEIETERKDDAEDFPGSHHLLSDGSKPDWMLAAEREGKLTDYGDGELTNEEKTIRLAMKKFNERIDKLDDALFRHYGQQYRRK
jgi:hypothetical protein